MDRKQLIGVLSGLAAASIWGGMYVVSKVLLAIIPPFALLGIRLLIGALILGGALLLSGWPSLTAQMRRELLWLGFVGYGISLGLQFLGTYLSTASNGAVLTSATPAFVFLFARWILDERISKRRWLALIFSTLGVLMVIDVRAAQLSPRLFWGNLALVGAGITWALHSVLVRKASRSTSSLTVSYWAFMGGMIFGIPVGGWEAITTMPYEFTPMVIAGVLYIGVISTALAFYLWNRAFELLDAGVASLTFFAQPVVGTILGVFFLGESITPFFLLGGALIGVGIWLAAKPAKKIKDPVSL